MKTFLVDPNGWGWNCVQHDGFAQRNLATPVIGDGGREGGDSSSRTVIRNIWVPFPPPSGVSVLSTTSNSSSPSKVDGTTT